MDARERSTTIASLERTQAMLRETFATGRVPVEKEIEIRTQQFIYDAIQHMETYLNSLAQDRTSEYMITGSQNALDLAVEAGRQAAELAAASNLQDLGFALSHLDDAIVYTRVVYDGAVKGSDRHFTGLNNLVSQLNRRIEQVHDNELEKEAERLIDELHGFAIGQLGIMTSKKFKRTNSLEDLDKAIQRCRTGFEALPPNHEVGVDMLIILEASDLDRLVYYSGLLLEASPVGHRFRGRRLMEYAQRVKDAISQIKKHFSAVSSPFPEKERCQYTLSTKFEDLITLADYLPGSSEQSVSTNWLWDLKRHLRIICKAPVDSQIKSLTEQKLAAAVVALEELYKEYSLRLQEEVDLLTKKLKSKKATSTKSITKVPDLGVGEYETEFGLRKLAFDSEAGDIILTFNIETINEALGYDLNEPYLLPIEEFVIRESRIEQQAIERAQSKGRHPNLDLCRMCRDIAKPLKPTEDGLQLTAEGIRLPFGNFYQLMCRKHCAICHLIFSAITTDTDQLHPHFEAIDWEVQGTRLKTGNLSTGEQILRVEYGLKHVGELRVLTPQNYPYAMRQFWECIDESSINENLRKREGPIYSQNGQQVNISLIKRWLNDCDYNHGSVCNNARLHTSGDDDMTMLFIDVVENRLVPATSREKYFALSYVWGRVDMFNTTKANYQERKEPQALSTIPFPKTIKDAIRLVKSLGERFLWVDAICMVQDDKEQMARDVPKMNIVYGQAFATIVALHGESADAGLPGVSPGTRKPQHIEVLHVSDKSPDLDYDPQSDRNETVCLVATPRPLSLELDISKWNTRGWIFQERLLSRRCIYFSADAVYFQCSKQTVSEIGVNEEYTSYMFDKVPMEPRQAAKRAAQDNPLDTMNLLRDMTSKERQSKAFGIYKDLVRSYSRREFSFKSDVINGFAGVFAVLEKYFQSETHSGLPATVLSHALLWTPAARIPRRGMRLPTLCDMSMGKPDTKFPSWSWAGWDGPVEYRLFSVVEGNVQLPTPLFDGKEVSTGRGDHEGTDLSTSSAPGQPIEPENHTIAKLVPDPSRGSTWIVGPPQPGEPWDPPLDANILSFSAPVVPCSAFVISAEKEYLVDEPHIHNQGKQAIRRIYDHQGKRCGLWWEQAGYGYVGLGMHAKAESRIRMVGISTYGDVYHRREGPSRVEGEIRLFDGEAFPEVGPGSGLVNVLVVDEGEEEEGIGYRCTVAVIHVGAWNAARPKEERLQLA
ncbi:heterokaryon incompatibility protein-domain-containing protein [Hypomontagnella monticulosa]|nr:heterokaryon incompatibility protein-domain-containing protein [Hypomontagnella monticulosa]